MDLKTLHKITYGLYLVTSKNGEKINGQIANTVFQVTSDPPRISVTINKKNLTHEFIEKNRVFAVSILSKETPLKFIGNFGFKSGRDIDKFKNIPYEIGKTGSPIVRENSLGFIEARVLKDMDAGTHTIFVGDVVDCERFKEGEPMTYAYYHEIKGGKSPKTAPTYIKEEVKKEVKIMKKYVCTVCGYIYDPEKGDPDGGIKPGTPFEDIPDDWVCPVCGAEKSMFEPYEE